MQSKRFWLSIQFVLYLWSHSLTGNKVLSSAIPKLLFQTARSSKDGSGVRGAQQSHKHKAVHNQETKTSIRTCRSGCSSFSWAQTKAASVSHSQPQLQTAGISQCAALTCSKGRLKSRCSAGAPYSQLNFFPAALKKAAQAFTVAKLNSPASYFHRKMGKLFPI